MQTQIERLETQHAALVAEAGALIDGVEKEARSFTPAEETRHAALVKDIQNLTARLTQAKNDDSMLREIKRVTAGIGSLDHDTRDTGAPEQADDNDVVLSAKRSAYDVVKKRGVRYANESGADKMSLGRIIRAMAFGDRRGLSDLETRALSEGTDSAGGFTTPEILSAQFIDRLRPALVTQRAGAQIVLMHSDKLDIARLASGPTLAWKVENAAITEGAVALERVQFVAKTLPVLVKMSVELAEDSVNIDAVIQRELSAALATELDRVALRGSGVAPEPKGILNQTGVTLTSQGVDGTALGSYDAILDAGFAVIGANVPAENVRVIYNTRAAKSLAKLKNTLGDPLEPPSVLADWGKPLITNTIPNNLHVGASTDASEIYVGDFSELLMGIRTSFRLEVSRQAGDATSSAFSNLQVWVRCYLRADIQLAHPEAFVVVLGVRP